MSFILFDLLFETGVTLRIGLVRLSVEFVENTGCQFCELVVRQGQELKTGEMVESSRGDGLDGVVVQD